jgi:hypothetical protein
MNTFQKGCLILLSIPITLFIGIIVAIKGWGLEPQNWWYIIGVSFFGHLFVRVVENLVKGPENR